MRTCKFCGGTGEDKDIIRHEQICGFIQRGKSIEIGRDKNEVEAIGENMPPDEETPEALVCPKCGKVCKSVAGLASHVKSCKGE